MSYDGYDVHFSKEDALNQHEFERLMRGAHGLDDYYSLQARFAILLAGRLGMRKGEITHITKRWVDFDREMICVPQHENCIKARESMGICGYCMQQAKQRVEHNNELGIEEAEELAWLAKTSEAVWRISSASAASVTGSIMA